jgi:glycerol-3-phosphate cytidylyltransferase
VTKVATYGTYGLLHCGHVNLLRRARELGDHLTMGLSTSAFDEGKGEKCFQSYKGHVAVVSAIRYVHCVIPGNLWDQKISDIQSHRTDIFIMGNDWAGRFDFLKGFLQGYLPSKNPDISTTLLKEARGA